MWRLCAFVCLLVPAPFCFPRLQHGLVCHPRLFSLNNQAQLFIISSSLNAVYQLLPELDFLLDRLSERCVVLQKVRPAYLKMLVGGFSLSGKIPPPSDSLVNYLAVANNNRTRSSAHNTHDFRYSEKNNFNFQSCIWSQVLQQRLWVY